MKSYDFALDATTTKKTMQVQGNAFYYVNATSAGSTTLTIKPERGEDFDLKPGQWVRLPENVGTWYIGSKDGASVITGQIIIGDGLFGDSNIFSTTVIAPGQTVGITGNVNVTNKLPAMTAGWAQTGALTAGVAVQIVSAAANVNGIVVHAAQVQHTGNGRQSFLAKATAPASAIDGIVILSHDYVGAASQYDLVLGTSVTIPAGMGLYYFPTGDPNGRFRSISYTVQ